MKRWLCLLLALALLPLLPAAAETAEFESIHGFTLWYDDELFLEEEADDGAELLVPLEEDARAVLRCTVGEPVPGDWSAEDPSFTPLEDELDLAIPYACFSTLSEDGTAAEKNLCVCAPDGFYVFSVQYVPDDAEEWAEQLWDVVKTVEFPPQPAVAGSFRLDFFQGGAAGMQFTDILVDEDAEMPITLRPMEEVTDFVLEAVEWDEELFTVAGAETLYSAAVLGPGDNLNLYCYIPDVLPTLRIQCVNSQGERECWYIFQSGRDGSLLLLGENEV